MILKIFLIIISLLFVSSIKAQLSIDWYKNSEGLNIYSSKKSMYNSMDSCIYTAGMFSGQFEMDGVSISTSYSKAFFLMKTKSDGELVWLKKVAENDEYAESTSYVALTSSLSGSLLLSVTFNWKLFFGSDSTILPQDPFITGAMLFKLDTSGTDLWHKQVFATNIQSIAVNESENVFLTGSNSNDAYLTAYSEIGDSLWTRTGGSISGYDEGREIQVDSNGIYVLGQIEPNAAVYFDTEHPTFVNPYFHGGFLAKYDAFGQIQWVRSFYTANFAQYVSCKSISLKNDMVVVGGSFQGSILKLSPSAPGLISPSSNHTTSFLLCYNPNGNVIWKKTPRKCLSGDEGLELGLFFNERLIYSSSFSGSLVIAGDTLSSANNNLVIEAFDTLGNHLWYKQINGSNIDGATSFFKAKDDLILNISTKSTSLQIDNTIMTLSPVSDQMVLVRFNVSTLGLDENEEPNFSIFPNPTDGMWNLKTTHDLSGKHLQVFSVSGGLVYEQLLDSGNIHQMNTLLPLGVYLIQLSEQSEKPIRLVIK